MGKINEENRKQTILVLEKYLSGDIPPLEILSKFPDCGYDELMESIFNSFCEPLGDTGYTTWEEFTKVCITALRENWSLEKFERLPEE